MTEKEKMLAGEIYDCGDPELIRRWHYAKELQLRYNNTDSRNGEELSAILNELLGSHGDYGENIHVGSHVEINMNCVFLDCNRITIGDNCGIGPGVHIYAVTHPVNPAERLSPDSRFWKSLTAPVTIGNNVWIGGSSVVLPGVTIGDNVTIGAGSVVTKDIPSNCLAVGNPCRIIREV